MDWSFLNILKNAEFNTLMFAAAVTCWILHCCYPNNEWYFGVALLCTSYCFLRFFVYIYKLLCFKAQAKRTREYNKQMEIIDARPIMFMIEWEWRLRIF